MNRSHSTQNQVNYGQPMNQPPPPPQLGNQRGMGGQPMPLPNQVSLDPNSQTNTSMMSSQSQLSVNPQYIMLYN
jgi:hypothetical protein